MTEFLNNIWFLGKPFFLLAFLVYIAFAAVVVRQVYLMTTTLKIGFETQVKTIAWLHLILSIGVFLFVLFFL